MARERKSSSGAGGAPYLIIENLYKQFGAFTALRNISLTIFKGEFVCFLGPSGCGKTTLLRAIAGLDIQTSGRIVQGGKDISALPPVQRNFGIVFQSYALFPNLTTYKNVAYGLENRHMKRDAVRARVKELLELVGLPDEGSKYSSQLSGGQQQRVALARALATSPGLLLLDEPLSALDAKVRVYLRREIRRLHDRLGVTTVMVTHDQEEALTMADRIVVMDQGVIDQVGTPFQIYSDPSNAFVADFIGSMNFLPGRAAKKNRVRLGRLEMGVGGGMRGVKEGSPLTLCVRPEDVTVLNVNKSTPNSFDAKITELEFLGSFYRASLSSADMEDGELRADLSVNMVRLVGAKKGKTLRVALPEERLRVFTDTAGKTISDSAQESQR